MDTQITITISGATGEITVSANGQDTPVASLDEAITAVQAIAQEALGSAGGINPAAGAPALAAPTDAGAEEEAAMVKNYRNKNNRGML